MATILLFNNDEFTFIPYNNANYLDKFEVFRVEYTPIEITYRKVEDEEINIANIGKFILNIDYELCLEHIKCVCRALKHILMHFPDFPITSAMDMILKKYVSQMCNSCFDRLSKTQDFFHSKIFSRKIWNLESGLGSPTYISRYSKYKDPDTEFVRHKFEFVRDARFGDIDELFELLDLFRLINQKSYKLLLVSALTSINYFYCIKSKKVFNMFKNAFSHEEQKIIMHYNTYLHLLYESVCNDNILSFTLEEARDIFQRYPTYHMYTGRIKPHELIMNGIYKFRQLTTQDEFERRLQLAVGEGILKLLVPNKVVMSGSLLTMASHISPLETENYVEFYYPSGNSSLEPIENYFGERKDVLDFIDNPIQADEKFIDFLNRKQLSDIDISIHTRDLNEYKELLKTLVSGICKEYKTSYINYTEFKKRTKWYVYLPNVKRIVEIFLVYDTPASLVKHYHLDCVRQYYDGEKCHMMFSCILSLINGIIINPRLYFGKNLEDNMNICFKYAQRGFAQIFTKTEIENLLNVESDRWKNIQVGWYSPANKFFLEGGIRHNLKEIKLNVSQDNECTGDVEVVFSNLKNSRGTSIANIHIDELC